MQSKKIRLASIYLVDKKAGTPRNSFENNECRRGLEFANAEREGAMKDRFSLIVLGPSAPQPFKFHVSRRAIVILGLAFLISFITVASVGHFLHRKVDGLDPTPLRDANMALKLEAKEANDRIKLLDAKLLELEDTSKRLEQLVAE